MTPTTIATAGKPRTAARSRHAATAHAIRSALKTAFPSVRFGVRARSFAGGDAVDIEWTDGPTTEQVDALTRRHQYGHFDGMIDLYEYSNTRDDIPQVKFVQTRRDMSDDARRAMVEHLNRTYGYGLRLTEQRYGDRTWLEIDRSTDSHIGPGWASDEVHRQFYTISLLCKDCGAPTLPGDNYCPQCGVAAQGGHDA